MPVSPPGKRSLSSVWTSVDSASSGRKLAKSSFVLSARPAPTVPMPIAKTQPTDDDQVLVAGDEAGEGGHPPDAINGSGSGPFPFGSRFLVEIPVPLVATVPACRQASNDPLVQPVPEPAGAAPSGRPP